MGVFGNVRETLADLFLEMSIVMANELIEDKDSTSINNRFSQLDGVLADFAQS